MSKKLLHDECVVLIRMIYRHNAAGDYMHIVLDDGNVEDDYIGFCIAHISAHAEAELENSWLYLVELACCTLLLMMEEDERRICIWRAFHDDGTDT